MIPATNYARALGPTGMVAGRRRRGLSLTYRRFLAIQLIALFLSLSMSEEGNAIVYAFKFGATALPALSIASLYLMRQNVAGPLARNLRSFRHVWAIMALGIVGCFWAADTFYSVSKVVVFAATFISLTGILIQYEFLHPSQREKTLLRHLLYASFALLAIMVVNFSVLNAGVVTAARNRAGGNLIAPTNAAATVGVAFFMALHHLIRNPEDRPRPRVRAIAMCTVVMALWALIILSTRAAFICTAGALFFAPMLTGGLRLTYGRLVLGTAVVIGLVFILANEEAVASSLARENETASVWTLSGRTWLWTKALGDLTSFRFFLGYGYAAISETVGIQDWWTGDTTLAGAHNAYLQVLLGSGIFGLLLYLGFLRLYLKYLRSKTNALPNRQRIISFGIFLYFIIFSITEHLFGLNVTPTFFLISAIFTATRFRVTQKEARQLDAPIARKSFGSVRVAGHGT